MTDVQIHSVVLLSGGLDSAVLLAHEAQLGRVQPVYVSVGLAWEAAERRMVDALVEAPAFEGRVEPLAALEFNMRDVYSAAHWAVRGAPPAYDTPDEDVYLSGRNLVLLTKAGIFAASKRALRIALGILANNPFPDATPAFLDAIARALSLGLDRQLEVATPFSTMHKEDVIGLGHRLGVPFQHTLSCMNPQNGTLPAHCGLCSKCRERRDAFAATGLTDPAHYAHASPR